MPQNSELERVINLTKNAVEQLERQNPCPRFTVRDQGLPQQQYLKQAVPPEATSVNSSKNSRIEETKRIKKL